MTGILIESSASLEIEEAAKWYEAQQIGLGIEFVLEIDIAITKVQENPKLYFKSYRGIRRALLHKFPYAIYFVINDTKPRILAVLHQASSDATISSRLR